MNKIYNYRTELLALAWILIGIAAFVFNIKAVEGILTIWFIAVIFLDEHKERVLTHISVCLITIAVIAKSVLSL